MIKHIVMWRFKAGTEEQMHNFLAGLEGLRSVIPQIRSMEIGINCTEAPAGKPGNYDAVLVTTFDSQEDLDAYKNDPRHVKVSSMCKEIREDRACVDYIV